jgi:parallel beta-helix repeat protein
MRRRTALGILLLIIVFSGTLTLCMLIPSAKAANFVSGTIYLRADGSIEPADAPVDVHGNTYTLTGDIQSPLASYCIVIERSGILLDGYGYTIEGWNLQEATHASSTGIYVGAVTDIEIRNINIKGCICGIEVQNAERVNIQNNTIDSMLKPESGDEPYGFFLLQSTDVNVDRNQLLNSYIGILVQSSSCTISNNRIMDNAGAGVYIDAQDISVTSNLIARNDLGIEIIGSNNLIKANDILSNKRIGVFLGDSQGNILVENNIAGHNSTNAFGVQMHPYDSGNAFYHNDFANNYIQVDGGDLAQVPNVWDNGYPQGGNYWDTYHGFDSYSGPYQNETGSDGIGDAAYQITTANVDRYPLMALVRAIPDIGEAATTPASDYTLPIIIAVILVAGILVSGFLFYQRRKRQQAQPENLVSPQVRARAGRILVPIFLTLSLMIILNFAFISTGSYGLGAIGVSGGALYFDEVLIGFLSAAAAIFVTWRIILHQNYAGRLLEEVLFAAVASFLFAVYLLSYTAYNHFELFGYLQSIQPALVIAWTFATALIGCCVGFLLGGVGLKKMRHPEGQEARPRRISYVLGGLAVFVFAGLFSGYAFGYIVWAAIGQVQAAMGVQFPEATVFPPSLVFLAVCAVVGAALFALKPLWQQLKRAK